MRSRRRERGIRSLRTGSAEDRRRAYRRTWRVLAVPPPLFFAAVRRVQAAARRVPRSCATAPTTCRAQNLAVLNRAVVLYLVAIQHLFGRLVIVWVGIGELLRDLRERAHLMKLSLEFYDRNPPARSCRG